MKEAPPAMEFGSWSATGISFTVEYSFDLLEQIRAAAQAGLRRPFSNGGGDVGGVLFGTRFTRSIRILAWRPIEYEEAQRPALMLLEKDRTALAKVLRNATADPDLTGLYPLGWFVSHTKAKLDMTALDHKIFKQYFPFACQTTLVLHPETDGSAQAKFFVRDSAGKVQSAKKARQFTIDPEAGILETAQEPEISQEQDGEPVSHEPEPIFKTDAGGAGRGMLSGYRKWIWIIPVLLAAIVLGIMLPRNGAPKPSPSFSLRANEVGGELRLEWDRNAELIREATQATLAIKDGDLSVPFTLDAARLRDGYFSYPRKSGDLELKMTVYRSKGQPVTELATFVGPPITPPATPPVTTDETNEASRERDQLKAQVEQLRESLRKESAHNRQLQDTVRILQQRVQVQKLLEPKQ